MRRYEYKKIYKWDDATAYLAGLIAADGCLLNNGRHINVTSKDSELIELCQKILNMKVKVFIKHSSYGGSAFHLQFSNVALYDFLTKAGITTAKSKTINKVQVPDEYYADFLRGYFDGDGTVYGAWDKRWPNSLMYYSSFASGSTAFIEWLQMTNSRLFSLGSGQIKVGARVYSLTYAKSDTNKLFTHLYHADDLPLLTRKYKKFVDFLRADPYANKVKVGASAVIGSQASLRC